MKRRLKKEIFFVEKKNQKDNPYLHKSTVLSNIIISYFCTRQICYIYIYT